MVKRNRLEGFNSGFAVYALPDLNAGQIDDLAHVLESDLPEESLEGIRTALGKYRAGKTYLAGLNSLAEDRDALRPVSQLADSLATALLAVHGPGDPSPTWKRLAEEFELAQDKDVPGGFWKQKHWHQPAAVGPHQLIGLMQRLSYAADITVPGGRPRSDAERELVESLADVFERVTGCVPTRWYDDAAGRERGRFKEFCEAALSCLPEAERPQTSMDGIVREVCESRKEKTQPSSEADPPT